MMAELHLIREVHPPGYRHHLMRLTLGGGGGLSGWLVGTFEGEDDFYPAREIRDLPIARWVRGAKMVADLAAADDQFTPEFELVYRVDEPDVASLADELVEKMFPGLDEQKTPAALRRRKYLRHLAQVAVIYDHSVVNGRDDPAAEVARRFHAQPGTARTWVHRARKEGLIGATAPRDVAVMAVGEIERPWSEEEKRNRLAKLEQERAQLKLELAKINAAKERGHGPAQPRHGSR
ncbi:hypothetical protein D7I43_27980 [Micromonospora globbae]|uniref:Uncharacterized protein n=1 Tax=Micromonospora globbae TaxID=1894969 RepID=A0A420ETX2_9ACTN|nr:hypothetical protein D7I43_27980 [Micromonospora globbae]